ncbi:MAG TPA: hypothetical protein VN962_06000 [Polyangia bacterium]|nr:hypothetical protein [Polyangia bacterium]
MDRFRRGAAGLVALVSLAAVAGCGGSSSSSPDGGARTDARADTGSLSCTCQSDTQALTIPFDCYCARYRCDEAQPAFACTGGQSWTVGCGLTAQTIQTAGGDEIRVWDQSGKLVGVQSGSDTSPFVCPTNQGIQRFLLRAGTLPDSCATAIDCCDAGTGCPGTSVGGT